MKTYLVVASRNEELEGIFTDLEHTKPIFEEPDIYLLQEENYSIYGMIGGVGKVSMALKLGQFLTNISVDEIISLGSAFMLSNKLKENDIFVAENCCYHDVDFTAFGYPKGQMAQEPLYFNCDPDSVEAALSIDKNYKTGLLLSGDTFITEENLPSSFYEDFPEPMAVDTNATAVGQVAHDLKIPFLVIRSISNESVWEETKEGETKSFIESSRKCGKLALQIIQINSK